MTWANWLLILIVWVLPEPQLRDKRRVQHPRLFHSLKNLLLTAESGVAVGIKGLQS